MDKKYRWTVDVELDAGGRVQNDQGIKEGLPLILQAFKRRHIKALFFISTELLPKYLKEIQEIKDQGHEIGSHGHFHVRYKERFRAEKDKEISETVLRTFGLSDDGYVQYRAPKFSTSFVGQPYSFRHSHVSLLRHMWFKEKIKENTVIYLHPFDLVEWYKAPNLFCSYWYAEPKKAYETFLDLTYRYNESYITE